MYLQDPKIVLCGRMRTLYSSKKMARITSAQIFLFNDSYALWKQLVRICCGKPSISGVCVDWDISDPRCFYP